MRHTFLLIGLIWLVSSCASVINGRYSQINIKSDEAVNYIYNGDTVINKLNEPIAFVAKNSREPLAVSVFTEEKSKQVYILPRKASVYWLNALSPYFSGFLVDEITGKKWEYPRKVFINMDLPGNSYTPYFPMDSTLLYRKNKIGFNPFSLAMGYHPGIEVAYERLHGNKWATQFSYSHFLSRDNDFARNSKGYKIILEEKYFFRNKEKMRWYIGLAAEYLYKKHDADIRYYTIPKPGERFYFKERTRIRKEFTSITPHIGFQHYLTRAFVIETYFGVGLRYRKTTHPLIPENYIQQPGFREWFDLSYDSNKMESTLSTNLDFNLRLNWVF
tara:strand:- start:1515 stop:2507 length:993 start_codon:yes stop_codon:yes gene_type:complete